MLPKEVSDKYELVDWKGGHQQFFGSKFGTVNIKTMTLAQADRLYKRGFHKLRLKSSSTKSTDTSPSPKTDKKK